MECNEIKRNLERFFDGELPLSDRRAIEEHLERCRECTGLLDSLRAVNAAINRQAVFSAPAGLKRRVRRGLRDFAGEDTRASTMLPWLGFGGGVTALVFLAAWVILSFVLQPGYSLALDEVVGAHVRSLMVDHATDIASADQHTVKPWFKGKLDFAPPVRDLSNNGFVLLGGRIDYIEHRPVAALVYKRRAHVINVFVWPARDEGDRRIEAVTRRGYHILHWVDDGLNYWAISDLNEGEFKRLAELLRAQEFGSAGDSTAS